MQAQSGSWAWVLHMPGVWGHRPLASCGGGLPLSLTTVPQGAMHLQSWPRPQRHGFLPWRGCLWNWRHTHPPPRTWATAAVLGPRLTVLDSGDPRAVGIVERDPRPLGRARIGMGTPPTAHAT